ncbi:hypothetical protein RM549_17385 [Salegentibacter sp. F188]|uniref:Uncharacterized protein n=1 Tax=Autumnicola patrickiae TaxID=3075591 RepID=A0ABU3E6E7_9FLAO|nr:hypothetical protein [Salegentibacter sp. F188]MDT0691568.1 hypothetical protein [Salegentibacter sp. F188]
MKRELPEIEEFLTRNNFSDENLKELSAAINSKYKNPAIKNEVISTVSPYLRNFGIDFSSYFNSADKKTDGKQKRKRVLLKSKKRRKNKTISKASGNIKSPKAGNVRVKSLPQQFPEIDVFFERKSFSEDELNSLKDMVEQQYRNEQMRKAGLSLIALHLVKYKIESTQKPIPQASVKLKKPVEKKKIPKPKQAKPQNESKPKKDVDQVLLELKDMSISDISNRINIPRSVLFYELEKNGIEKRGTSKLTALEFGLISTLIRRRLGGDKIIGAKNKTGKAIKRNFGKGKKNYDGVFGKIQRYGGAGKIIYTRM